MSATIGTSQPRSRNPFTIFSRLRASFTVGAVIRTISQPTFASSIVCWIDISVSIVSQVIIDWTRIGLFPPIPTLPTRTSREARRRNENGDAQYFTSANLKRRASGAIRSGQISLFGLRLRSVFIEDAFHEWQILDIEKADVSNRANDQNSADALHHFEHAHVQRFASDRLDQSEQNVPTVEHRNREHVQDREIDVQDYAQPKGQLPAALAHEEQIINSSNPDRPAEVLQFDVGLGRSDCAKRIKRARHAVMN